GGGEGGGGRGGAWVCVPRSDVPYKAAGAPGRGGLSPVAGGGLFAIRPADGTIAWTGRANGCGERPTCSPALSAPAAAIPGVVFSGSMDGHFRGYSSTDGKVIWDFDTAREFATVNGVAARGGTIDVAGPAIANGMVLTTSGYAQWGGMRGNVLLAFSVDGK